MIRTTCRLSVTIALITACVIWTAIGLRLVPDSRQPVIEQRVSLCESLSIYTAWFARTNQRAGLETLVNEFGRRNANIASIGIYRNNKQIADYRNHASHWIGNTEKSTTDSMQVNIQVEDEPWGIVQIQFLSVSSTAGLESLLLIAFCGATVCLLTWAFLSRSFKYLNPGNIVPSRVRNALDAMAEGLLLLDTENQIVLANSAFSVHAGTSVESLLGTNPSKLDWRCENGSPVQAGELPWEKCLQQRLVQRGSMLRIRIKDERESRFIVNATPIIEEKGDCRGILASFDDVTDLEEEREEMGRMLNILKNSRDEIRQQNEQLYFLASRDPMTGCLNRRAFHEVLKKSWLPNGTERLGLMMLDIDNFKSINDHNGHAAGDEVIMGVAKAIVTTLPESSSVCRYGGEEFCVAMPGMRYEDAMEIAEKLREHVESGLFGDVACTISIGVSERKFLAMDAQHLIDQADQCLYVAKRSGRNLVVGWPNSQPGIHETLEHAEPGDSEFIQVKDEPRVVVAALFTALHFRDRNTAIHSARVASLAIELGSRSLNQQTLKSLETAALLHDIGKIGIPDNILHRPDRLTDHEMALMRRKGNIAVSISRSALISSDVSTIIANHTQSYRNGIGWEELQESSSNLFIACNILHICDAFDSMINNQEYRNAKGLKETIDALRQHSPEQFAPELVESLVDCIMKNPTCMLPLAVPGAILSEVMPNDSVNLVTAAQIGELAPLRTMMRRLKREALSESPEVLKTIERLEENLKRNDDEFQKLYETTQEILELCRQNSIKSDAQGVIDWLYQE